MHSLAQEGLNQYVIWTGDILFDFVEEYSDSLPSGYGNYPIGEYVLASIHHEENLDSETMCSILKALSDHPRQVLFVTHPRTRKRLQELALMDFGNIEFIPM